MGNVNSFISGLSLALFLQLGAQHLRTPPMTIFKITSLALQSASVIGKDRRNVIVFDVVCSRALRSQQMAVF